jgi:hypothetical protein
MNEAWLSVDVTPIFIPENIHNFNRNNIGPSESFGLAFTYVYQNYILKKNNISLCMENDFFPIKSFNVEEYIEGYDICGDLRFNASQLPDRNLMFWLGFIIFSDKMSDRETFTGYCEPITNKESGKSYWIDCGGTSYYWIIEKERKIRQIVTNGNESYDGFKSLECTPHNITNDIYLLPEIFRTDYLPYFRVLIYENSFIHLERMGKENDNRKELWWNNCFQKLI